MNLLLTLRIIASIQSVTSSPELSVLPRAQCPGSIFKNPRRIKP